MKEQTLVVYFDGVQQDPLKISNFSVEFENEEIILRINTVKEIQDAPSEQGIIETDKLEIFHLTGDDFDTFKSMSEFRLPENIGTKEEIAKVKEKVLHVIESDTYNIIDVQSVLHAMMELLEQEKKLLKEYKVISALCPTFIYEKDKTHFKLVEKCTLFKTSSVSTS